MSDEREEDQQQVRQMFDSQKRFAVSTGGSEWLVVQPGRRGETTLSVCLRTPDVDVCVFVDVPVCVNMRVTCISAL